MTPALVSTIIPVYNRAAMLREAVDSVVQQDWQPLEVIIVDDGSTDDTPQVMSQLQARHPQVTQLLHRPNSGPGVAREAGLEIAQGEFVQFLDSDDLLMPGKFRAQVGALRADPEASICYGKTWSRNDGVRAEQPAQRTGEVHRTLFPALLDEPLWPTLSPLYRHSFLKSIGPWPAARQLEDWQYDAQAAAAGAKLVYLDAFVAETRNHGEDRLCHLWRTDRQAMRDRIDAFISVLGHARNADVPADSPEMRRFARTLFWMSRQAGARGFAAEARQLHELAGSCADARALDHRLYGLVAGVFGWQQAGRMSEALTRWKR